MKGSKALVYFGAGGAGVAYCRHSGQLPDFFVDNDSTKWGTSVYGIEVMPPEILTSMNLKLVLITSGFISQILPQLLSMGIEREQIEVPPKALMGKHPFNVASNRIQAATTLYEIMTGIGGGWKVVAGGGAALGFCRDGDFIHWDFDIDLFAPTQARTALFDLLLTLECAPKDHSAVSMNANLPLGNEVIAPIGIKFFDSDSDMFMDKYEFYTWRWPTQMFTQCAIVEIHGMPLNVPNPPDQYLRGVYGPDWMIPNPTFGVFDYAPEATDESG